MFKKLKTPTKLSLNNFVKEAKKFGNKCSKPTLLKTFKEINLKKSGRTGKIWLVPKKLLTNDTFWATYKKIRGGRGKSLKAPKTPKKTVQVVVSEQTKTDLIELGKEFDLKTMDEVVTQLLALSFTVKFRVSENKT